MPRKILSVQLAYQQAILIAKLYSVMNPKYLYSVSDNRSGELYISKHQRSPNNVKSHSSFYLLNLGISFPQTTNNIITMATYDSKGIYAAVRFWKALHKDFLSLRISKMKPSIIPYVKIIIGDVFPIRSFLESF